jgi:hypothetical protein
MLAIQSNLRFLRDIPHVYVCNSIYALGYSQL